MMEKVEEYDSEADSDFEEETPVLPRKRTRRMCEWTKKLEFQNDADAQKFVKDEGLWYKRTSTDTQDGTKKYYRCKSSASCNKQIYLHLLSDSQKVTLFESENTHDHSALKATRGISEEAKLIIRQLFDDGIKTPSLLLTALKSRNIEVCALQIKNFLHILRKKVYGNYEISLGQLDMWCRENSVDSIQSDEEETEHSVQSVHSNDKCFVTKYAIHVDEDDEDKNNFRIFLKTKRLMSIANSEYPIHADATYKLIWQGYPVLMVGTTDKNKSFHPYGIMVSKTENSEDFKFMFEAVKETLMELEQKIFMPTVLIADASDAITNGFEAVFGSNFHRVMCWPHAQRAIEKRLLTIGNKDVRKAIQEEIEVLHFARSKDNFEIAYALLKKKFDVGKSDVANFFIYMDEYWIRKNFGWFTGFVDGVPCHNNALESTNNVIKRNYTFRKRLPMSEFLSVAKKLVEDWSQQRIKEKPFHVTPKCDDAIITKAYHWVKLSPTVIKEDIDGSLTYYIGPKNSTITEECISDFKSKSVKKDWCSFDEYKVHENSLWIVKMNADNWEKATCSCITFMKNYVCKHSLGMAVLLKLFKVPMHLKQIPIGEKRKRGRPSKTKPALLKQ